MMRACANLLLVGVVAGCSTEEPESLSCSGPSTIVYDPFAHEVCLTGCYDSFDCPRGSICARLDDAPMGGGRYCALPTDVQQTSRTALLDGFGVPEMKAELIDEDALELAWTRPENGKVVNCALFSCMPAFRLRSGDGWSSSEGVEERAVIANYDHCVLASEVSTNTEGSFNLRERENSHRIPSDLLDSISAECLAYDRGGKDFLPHCAPITELAAGCWAYDHTRIVAATRLYPIDIRRGMYNYKDAFVVDASGRCPSEGLTDERDDSPGRESFRVCVRDDIDGDAAREPETTGGDDIDPDDAGSEPVAYGICRCDTGDGACTDPNPCKRPCLSDCDCRGEPGSVACTQPELELGYCSGTECLPFFP